MGLLGGAFSERAHTLFPYVLATLFLWTLAVLTWKIFQQSKGNLELF